MVEVVKEGSAWTEWPSVGCVRHLWHHGGHTELLPRALFHGRTPRLALHQRCQVARCPGETCTIYTLSGEGLQKIHPRLLELLGGPFIALLLDSRALRELMAEATLKADEMVSK